MNIQQDTIRSFEDNRKAFLSFSSAILYSLAETARANHLRIYDYLELLLTELVQHSDDTCRDFVYDLMPWS